MNARYALGLDYGTNSVRALLVRAEDGREIATSHWDYHEGEAGVILGRDPNLARQHPRDYVKGAERAIRGALAKARRMVRGFRAEQVAGVGVDATGSTPLPVDAVGRPLALQKRFEENPAAMAWLWKDHTAADEADEITRLASEIRPEYLEKCGGAYSSEWYFSKILRCRRVAPDVFRAAHAWMECSDWIPAMLTDTEPPERRRIGVCAAGHKGLYHESWGGYPDADFLARLDPELGRLRFRLGGGAKPVGHSAGGLSAEWSKRTGLREGVAVSVGALDAHMGAVGSGVRPGTLVKILGTSTCDITVLPLTEKLINVPGISGIVPESVLPGHYGLEAGQSAVGDIFRWFVERIQPGGLRKGAHEALNDGASRLAPGESGLLALDWNNGNRSVLADPRLSGLLVGQTLHTTPAEIYRALIEATAFGALTIIRRLEESGVRVDGIINCGGIAEKSPLLMQIYADVTGRPMKVSRSGQTCALGAAIAGAVAGGLHPDIESAQRAMTGLKSKVYRPNAARHRVYGELYEVYRMLHDAFGTVAWNGNLGCVMKKLIEIRERTRR